MQTNKIISTLIQIFKLRKENAKELASIHQLSFPGFFLTHLGKDVLTVFYSLLIQDHSTIAWGVKRDEKLVGFFVASNKPYGIYYRLFKNNLLKLVPPLLIAFTKDISLLKRMIVSFSSSRSVFVPANYSVALLSICVSPSYAGIGIGKMLLRKLENELLIHKAKGYFLTTDAENNESTNKFYLNRKFILYKVYF